MEDFYPDGKIKYIFAVDYGKKQSTVSKVVQEKVINYMLNPNNSRVILLRLDTHAKLVTDGLYRWQTDTPNDIKSGKCQLREDFVSHVLEWYKKQEAKK